MRVKIGIEFEVDTDDEGVAKSAASQAAYDHLAFIEISGYSSDTETVEVQVDGHGKVKVKLGQDHD